MVWYPVHTQTTVLDVLFNNDKAQNKIKVITNKPPVLNKDHNCTKKSQQKI